MSAEAALQSLVYATLKADAGLAALINGRVYDRVRDGAKMPYVSFGPHDVVEDGTDCVEAGEHTLQLDVWSDAVGAVEAKRINAAVKSALHDLEATIDPEALVYLRVTDRRTFGENGGLVTHGIVRVSAYIEEV